MPVDVGELRLLRRCGEVVHRSEMEELGAVQLLAVVDREAKSRLGKVAAERVQAPASGIETLTLRREPRT